MTKMQEEIMRDDMEALQDVARLINDGYTRKEAVERAVRLSLERRTIPDKEVF